MHWSHQSNVLKIKVKIIGPEDFVGLVVGIFINPLLYLAGAYFIYKIVAMKKGLTPMELTRRILKGNTNGVRKTFSTKITKRVSLIKIATSYLPSIMLAMLLLPTSNPATAGFEIIDEDKPKIVLKKTDLNMPFSDFKAGVGSNVRLEDVVKVLIERPWKYEFVSKEIRALKVSWLSRNSTISEVLAQIGRNYGVETYYVESAGEVHVDWASGFCSEKIEEEKLRRDEFNKQIMFGAKDNYFPKVFKVNRDERTYLC